MNNPPSVSIHDVPEDQNQPASDMEGREPNQKEQRYDIEDLELLRKKLRHMQSVKDFVLMEKIFAVPVDEIDEDFDLDKIEYMCGCCSGSKPTAHGSTVLGRRRQAVTCSNCLAQVLTIVEHGYRRRTLGYGCMIPPVFCCWLLYLMPCCHTVRHYCPACHVFLGSCPGVMCGD